MKPINTVLDMNFTSHDIEKVAKQIALLMQTHAVVTFTGLLGAGKTTLIKAILKECGVHDVVTSPTFTYVNVYQNSKNNMFYHFDLYRIKSLEDFVNAGFSEYLYQPQSWCLIEWPEHVMPIIEQSACHVIIDYVEEELRHVVIKSV